MHKIIKKILINENLFKIYFEKKNLSFLPGQHFSLSIPGKSINREYSSYTSPNEDHIGFLIRRVQGGIMTNMLDKMKVGDGVNIYGPYGCFTPTQKQLLNKQIIFIASGTGIAPFVSIKKTYNIKNYKLFLGIRSRSDIADQDEFDQSNSYYCISRDNILKQNNHFRGRITKNLDKLDYIESYLDAFYMICGNSFMISDVYDALVNEKGIDPNNIITESFF
ncbi:FAD-binding oxidoreductase [Alphaproteobacteria bacterium]|nr:FAD-binding oxidoreductase [Alphaproteobacteria bacterium]